MDSLPEIIGQLKRNQQSLQNRLQLIENAKGNASEDDLRQLIQDAREIHEGSVLISYLVYQEKEKLQTPPPVQSTRDARPQHNITPQPPAVEPQPVTSQPIPEPTPPPIPHEAVQADETSEEDLLINAQEQALQATQEAIPPQEEMNVQVENSVNELIGNYSNTPNVAPLVDYSQETEDNSIAANLRKQGISDINSAIGINEKFLFTNELFGGKTETFIQEINKLNSFNSLIDATHYLETLARQNAWEQESDPYEKLKELVTRRYQ